MYKSFLFRRLPLNLIKHEFVSQVYGIQKVPLNNSHQWARQLSISYVCCKKRRSPEEKEAESQGRQSIRYSPKSAEVVGIWRNMTVKEIATVLNKDIDHVLKALDFADKTSDVVYTEKTVIHNPQIIRDVVKISGCRFKIVPKPEPELDEEENKDAVPAPPAPPEALRPRPPVVCVMGHVDHGKTTLLDALRDTSVVDQEFGGITQHIGAFEVQLASGEKVTFLDTPGHAAFTAMRSRGAHATDIVVLVVAADDGVMEQTVESIRMAREANVPILVAINKIDKPGVNIDRTMRALATQGIVCEALGGDIQAIPVSALKKQNLDTLVEALTLQAQLMELKADPGGYVEGAVIEAQLDPRTGKQATVLVQRGTLRRGSVIVAGTGWAKVRVLNSAEGRVVQEAPPSTPVSVLGWRELPSAGDQVLEVSSEKRAGEVMRWRHTQRMKEKQASDLEVIAAKEACHQLQYSARLARKRALGRYKLRADGPREKMIQYDTHPTLTVVVKGDVDGSVEAILDILETYDEHDRVKLDLVHFGVGPVTPNDLETAEVFKAVIYAFNVDCPPALSVEAKKKKIPIKLHNIIYRLVDDVKEEISARIPKRLEEEFVGEANVLQQFVVTENKKKVPVAGCRCVKGSLAKNALYRVVRGQEVVFEGKLASMKHLKDEVPTIKRDMECGLRFEEPFDVQPGDTVVCYKMVDAADTTAWDPGF
ncbi:translation initiation factor IF-2, mitochondrial isoform X3 [Spodoptera frugiperda]|uniref:Translation initiation factor IF-2, mitochondrial n=1 Tax=Spodoptera frugiperda TaxID=7108 RepID=A0A9R0EVU3_SPOFR|nr:translation initiation factor IF-2, mitochondrial isoform X1 [Spodoptera frugiperda]XP_050551432.1 translation initiation factor IF-2, mitochondrial isoform X2 [Spodoptera frugiperda]XP_050551433.1 translation initiation factor IF-2, mitochondrial isoform X3 [Spodoptera frugiperda]